MKTIYIYSISTLIVFFCASFGPANLPKETWRTGQLTFWDKTVLEGDLSYNWSAEMILLRRANGQVHTFSANQVSGFNWFDVTMHKRREFMSLSSALSDGRPKQAFFEVFMDGSLAVVRSLRRPHGLFKHMFSHPAYYNDQPVLAQNHDLFDYFVYDGGRLLALDRFYIDIYAPLMANRAQELKRYVSERNINDRTLIGRLVLIDHYNFLSQQDSKSASARGINGKTE